MNQSHPKLIATHLCLHPHAQARPSVVAPAISAMVYWLVTTVLMDTDAGTGRP